MWRMARGGEEGFTLLEVTIALAILSVAMVTLLSANNRALTLSMASGELTRAVTLARVEMEKLILTPPAPDQAIEKKESEEAPGFFTSATLTPTPLEEVFEVAVVISKKEGEEERELFTLTSHLNNPQRYFSGKPQR